MTICKNCNKKIKYAYGERTYCSFQCQHNATTEKQKCKECGKTFEKYKYRNKKRKRKYCSVECYNKNRSLIRGKKHGNFKSGKIVKKNGYRYLLTAKGYVLEHRYKLSKHLGRDLSKSEVIHHANGNKLDNRIENLLLFKNQAEHVKYHSTLTHLNNL